MQQKHASDLGPIWIDIEGLCLTNKEIQLLQHPLVGGVLLFKRNFSSLTQLQRLIEQIRTERPGILLAVDHEGGKIWRFHDQQFPCPPSAMLFGKLYEHDPRGAVEQIKLAAQNIATPLVALGIDLCFAPVLDCVQVASEVLDTRGYHSCPQIVSVCADAFIDGLNISGMAAVGKHFPGHGGCSLDTHLQVTEDLRTLSQVTEIDLVPYVNLQHKLSAIMISHVVFPNIDSQPASMSNFWVHNILRDKLNYSGVIITDCISMQGLQLVGDIQTRCQLALQVGADMVIASQQNRDQLLAILNNLQWSKGLLSSQTSKLKHKNNNHVCAKLNIISV